MMSDSEGDIELEDISMTLAQDSDYSHSTRAYVPDHEISAIHPAHEHQPRQRTLRKQLYGIVRNLWQIGFMPGVAFAYFGFCYAAATRVIPVPMWMAHEPANHLLTLKAGVTTINIIIIALALLPLKSLLDELKGEEFFRMLRISRSGVPLKAINNVSTPSHSYGRGLLSILQNHASKYYLGAVLTGLLATIISSLAPAALSVGVIYVDKDLIAFRVGSIAGDSVIKTYYFGPNTNPNFARTAVEAASMGWVQGVLGMSMTFQATSVRYGVPIALDLQPTDHARYITDVIVMDPICTWTVPNPPVVPPANVSNSSADVTIMLPDFGVTTQVLASHFQFDSLAGGSISLNVLEEGFSDSLFNISTGDPPITGVMGWLMSRCTSCKLPSRFINVTIDMSGIPTQEYHGVEKSNTTQPQTTEFSILMCDPRFSVETREVRLDGSGKMAVMQSNGLTRQGNLHLAQTRILLGKSLMKFSSDSGPDMYGRYLGSAAQIQMFFGPVKGELAPVLTPRPVEELTQGYTVAQQAAMRSYLSGRMASSYVPGRVQEMKVVFTSSLPHTIASTVLFAFAAIFISICHLRSNTEQFTLFSVAAALAHSNFTNVCEDLKYVDPGRGALAEDLALKSLGNRKIRLVNGGPWATLPVRGPTRLEDLKTHVHNADVALGSPPQNISFSLNVISSTQFALTPDCIYCQSEGMYDPSASSTLVKDLSLGAFGNDMIIGTWGYESITLGGLLQDNRSIMGRLGLFVSQFNETKRRQNVIYRMNEQDQLLNPVWGLRLGGENPQLTIGALDPKDYEGEINWVPLINDSSRIKIDALKGYNGHAFPLPSPPTVLIDSLSKDIYVPDLDMYMRNSSLIGPNQFINIYPPANESFGVRCNDIEHPLVDFSVEINGVDYPIDQMDLIRPNSDLAATGYCNVGIMKSDDYELGVTFLRSVYLAYRFPTDNCPGYYGFAKPRGGPTPTSMRKPRSTPTDASTCLSFVTPSSTPRPTIAVGEELQHSGAGKEKYAVYGRPNDKWVTLQGANDLPPLKVSGGVYGFRGW